MDGLECLACFPGNYRVIHTPTSDDQCLPCTLPCTDCVTTATTCLSCIVGYDYFSLLNQCISCYQILLNCSYCITGAACITCVPTYYYLLNGLCYACSTSLPNCL